MTQENQIQKDSVVSHFKVTLTHFDLMSLSKKKEYINKLYEIDNPYHGDKISKGIVSKFNNSIGFKPLVSTVNSDGKITSAAIESPETYLTPKDLLFFGVETPFESFDIIEFYLPNVRMEHPNSNYTYETRWVAEKWKSYLEKVFPHLQVRLEELKERPKLSLYEFALQYFYSSIRYDLNYTIEFSSQEKLTHNELKSIVDKINHLSKDKLAIRQFYCKSCNENTNGEKPYHIEIEYLTWYGKNSEDIYTPEQYEEFVKSS